jgi:hypothetical protein
VFIDLSSGAHLTAAGFAFVKIFDMSSGLQSFISAFEINIVATHKVSVRIAYQPVSRVHVNDTVLRGNVRGLFYLNRLYQKRLD